MWLIPLALAAVALALVQVGVARNHPASGFLTRTATALTGVGMLVMIGAVLLGLVLPRPLVSDGGVTSEPWVSGMVLVLTGSGLFAATLTSGTPRRRALGAVVILSAFSSAGLLVLSPADLVTTMRYSIAVTSAGVVFGSAWALFVADVLRRERSRAAEPHLTVT